MAGSHPSDASEEEQKQMLVTTMTTDVTVDHWEVQYSRFFNCPSISSSSAGGHHPSLVPLARKPKGSWISSFSSLAYLKLLTTAIEHSDTFCSIVLTVTLASNVVEEHYVSKLHFTWPHVSCLSGYPPRGSRVVFISYKDHKGQIQKFAVRFLTIYETERFINSLKEIFGHERVEASMSGISKSKTSSQSEIFPSVQTINRSTQYCDPISSSADDSQPMYRPTHDWSPITSSADTSTQPMHPIICQDTSQNSNPDATVSQDVQQKLSAFPPSFTSLLMNCCPATEQATQPIVTEEVSIRKEITKYLEDSSFQDLLSKVQKVINEFGDDLLV